MKYTRQTVYLCILATCSFNVSYPDAPLDQDYVELANTFKQEGNLDKAATYYKKALTLNADNFNAVFNLASLLFEQDNVDQALDYFGKAQSIAPDIAGLHFNIGLCYNKKSNTDLAITAFTKAVELNPEHTKALNYLVNLWQKKDKPAQALTYAQQLIAIQPNNSEIISRIACMYRDMDEFQASIPYFRKAVELQPTNVQAILELANTLNMLEETDEALHFYQRILDINPNIQEALYNYGFTLKKIGRYQQAMEIYERIIKVRPHYAHPHFSLSLCYLALGDFERGWKEYEWRWAAYNETPAKFAQPLWQGQELTGKTILLYAEQGLGDSFQFIRYAQVLKSMGATVLFQTQRPLKQMLKLCPYIDKVITDNEPLPTFDYQIPIMSLPMVLNTKRTSVPAQIPYLYADDNLVAHWQKKLAEDKNFKIGICWQGNANYSTQFLRKAVAAKSVQLKEFAALADVPGITVYSLQKVFGTDQLKEINDLMTIHDFGTDFDQSHGRFMDTAAVIKNLDLVITVDTSIAHCAAGLGAHTWILLPEPADWRWMINCNDTPWYPNVRLFRQPKTGDWKSVMHEVVQALLELMGHQTQSTSITTQQATSSEACADLIDKLTLLSIHAHTKH